MTPVTDLEELAVLFEEAAMRTIRQRGMDVWVLRDEVAYTANCFTVAAALRARKDAPHDQ